MNNNLLFLYNINFEKIKANQTKGIRKIYILIDNEEKINFTQLKESVIESIGLNGNKSIGDNEKNKDKFIIFILWCLPFLFLLSLVFYSIGISNKNLFTTPFDTINLLSYQFICGTFFLELFVLCLILLIIIKIKKGKFFINSLKIIAKVIEIEVSFKKNEDTNNLQYKNNKWISILISHMNKINFNDNDILCFEFLILNFLNIEIVEKYMHYVKFSLGHIGIEISFNIVRSNLNSQF